MNAFEKEYGYLWKTCHLKGNDLVVACFLAGEPQSYSEIVKGTGISQATVTRSLNALLNYNVIGKSGTTYTLKMSAQNECSYAQNECKPSDETTLKMSVNTLKMSVPTTFSGVSGPISPKEVVSNPYTSSSTTPKDTDTDTETDTEKRKLSYPLKGTLNEKKKILRKAKTEAPKTSEDSGTQKPEVTVEHVSPLDSFFQQFWEDYPAGRRKNNKPACYTWIKNHVRRTEYDAVLTGLDLWKNTKEWTREDGEYIPAPLVWLHQRRWESIKPDDNDPMALYMKASDDVIRVMMPGPEGEEFIRKRNEMGLNPDRQRQGENGGDGNA